MTQFQILVLKTPTLNVDVIQDLDVAGSVVETVDNGLDALSVLEKTKFDVVIADTSIPDMSGISLLEGIRNVSSDTSVICVAAEGTVSDAVSYMRLGAADFLLKPVSIEVLNASVRRILGEEKTQKQERSKRQVITQDPGLLKIFDIAKNIASSRATVLIQGESGTGKEVMAAFIHANDRDGQRPFVAVNCAALPDSLAEAELFGHEKGAFTGAMQRKPGKFELAHGGTILLDEISEMPLPLQAKLLRVIQEKQIDRIGGVKPVDVDVRIIAACNVDLQKAVKEKKFREDLYYRINVIPMTIPPLRERRGDIQLLAAYFLEKYSEENQRSMGRISDEALRMLLNHPWKGNVRELENTIERAVLLGNGDTLNPEHLFFESALEQAPAELPIEPGVSVKEMEKQLILKTLKAVDDNRTQAAELLGISIRTLRNKLRDYRQRQRPMEQMAGAV